MKNEIVAEVRKNRAEILQEFGGDVEAMLRSMMRRQGQNGREVVRLPPKTTAATPNTYPPRAPSEQS